MADPQMDILIKGSKPVDGKGYPFFQICVLMKHPVLSSNHVSVFPPETTNHANNESPPLAATTITTTNKNDNNHNKQQQE